MTALRILSLGAGVQSTTVLLMSLAGELPPLDHAIFADTGWEPVAVYDHLDKLKTVANEAGLSLHVVSAGNIRDDHAAPVGEHLFIRKPVKHPEFMGRNRTFMPFYLSVGDGGEGISRRTCTSTYKIEPIERKVRELLGVKYRGRWPVEHRVDQVIGISWDEMQRMRDPDRPAVRYVYPLVDLRMTRDHCHAWLAAHGWTAPRSACIGCPYHRNAEWRRMRDEDPISWTDAIDFDHAIRARQAAGKTVMASVPYLHDSRVPLDEADIDDPIPEWEQLDLFGGECEGMCGV